MRRDESMKTRFNKIFSVLAVFFFCLTTFTASAADFTSGAKLYLKPNSNWISDGARFAAYFFYKDSKGNESNQLWASMNSIGSGIYEVVAPKSEDSNVTFNFVIFCRMKGSVATNDWSNKWNQSGDLVYDGCKDLFTISSGLWDGFTTTWSKYNPECFVTGNGTSGNPWCGGKSWDTTNSKMDANGSIKFSKVPTGVYEFKVVYGCDWFGYTKLDDASKKICSDNNGNIKFTTTSCSDITIKYASGNISVTITPYTTKYYLAIGDTKVEMTLDDEKTQYVALKQNITTTDVLTIKEESGCSNIEYTTLESGSCGTTSNGSIKVAEDGLYDFYFKLSNNKLYIGANESNPTKYFIMGIDGDWDNGIEIKDKNPNNANEVMLTCLNVTSDAQIKIKEKKLCQEVWKNAVKDGSVVDKPSNDDNIELPEGVYSFYYNTKDHNLFIGNATPTKAYITGIAGDEKIEMDFDKTKNEFVLQNQQVQSTDKVKVLLEWSCDATAEYVALDGESCSTAESTVDGITMNGGYYYDFYFKLDSKQLYVGANTANPANADKYYLMGVDGDWTTGIELEPEGEDKMVKLGQEISKTDQLKIEKRTPCGNALYDGIEVESPVPYYRGENNNIVLEDGTYNFYFDKITTQTYISGTIDNANVVYLDPKVDNSELNWESDNARFAVYYYKSGPEPVQAGWVTAKKDDNGRYYAQFPSEYDTYIWCRMNPNSGVNNWDGEWNQTDNITYDADKTLTKLTTFGDGYNDVDAASYQMINCTFPAIDEDFPVMVRINQFVESDPCNYLFKSFEDAWEVLKQNKALCTVNGDAVTLQHPVNMLVTNGDKAYKGATEVHHTGGQVPATVIMFKDINPNGGEPLVITTADPRGNRAVLVHPVVRNCKNITFDRLDIVGDKDTKDNAMDMGVDMGETAHSMDNMALIPRPDGAEPSNITIQNCKVESWGRNALHIVGVKGMHIENNEFFTHYDYTGSDEENKWAVDWGATIKFVNSTDIKYLRNSSEGTLATSLFVQGCKRILVMNNVFWNDNAVKLNDLAKSDRTVASVRLVTYNNNDLKIENIGIYYNTFYIKDNEVGDGVYDHFDFFRLGGLMQNIDTEGERNAFNPEKIRFQYNNCYSYDDDIAGNNKKTDEKVKFYLQSFGHDTNWCQSFKYNNFWSEYDKNQEEKEPNHVSSNFEVGIFCTGENETYNAYIDMRGQVCATDPDRPGALVVKGSGLNIGTVIIDDVSGLGADKIFTDRLNGNTEDPIRPTIVVDNSNESLSPSDHIYKEPGAIHFYTSPIVGSQTTDVHVSSVALAENSKVYLSIVDGDVDYFVITDGAGQSLPTDNTGTYLLTDKNGSLDNEPLFVTFKRPTGKTEDATYVAFLQIQPASDQNLKLLIPLKGHNTVKVKDIKGAWTVGAFQQREQKPVKTIIWSGAKSTDWDNRNNWYKEDGTVVTCLDVLDTDLTVIIPSKNSENYVTPDGGIINYPTLPAISNEYDFKNARTNKWNGEQVNAGSNASASTTKVANKIYLEYGASLVGVEQLNSDVERYTEVEQEFVARRKEWLLVGSVVKPWELDEEGNQVFNNGEPKTRDFVSGDYYLNHLPHVYMHQARIDTDPETGDLLVNWNESFAPLNVEVDPQKVFAIRLPNQYGPKKWPASIYNNRNGSNYDGDKPHTYSYKGRFYNETDIPKYTNLEPGKPTLLTNTYPANIDVDELKKKGDADGTFLIYDYDQESFVPVGGTDAVILSQHGFVFTPANNQLEIENKYFLNNETGHRSLQDDILSLRLRVKNEKASVSSELYISYDELKEDKVDYAVDAPKVFNGMVKALPDVYVMRYDKNWAALSIPDITKPIPLGVRVSIADQTFKFTLVDSNLPFDIILEDRQEGKTYNLSAGETCEVSDLVEGKCEGRFYINLQEIEEELPEEGGDVTTDVEELDNSGIDIYTDGNRVIVSSTSDVELQTVMVTDISGRHQVYNVSGQYITIDLPVSTGVYTISVIGDKASRIEKLKLN